MQIFIVSLTFFVVTISFMRKKMRRETKFAYGAGLIGNNFKWKMSMFTMISAFSLCRTYSNVGIFAP